MTSGDHGLEKQGGVFVVSAPLFFFSLWLFFKILEKKASYFFYAVYNFQMQYIRFERFAIHCSTIHCSNSTIHCSNSAIHCSNVITSHNYNVQT